LEGENKIPFYLKPILFANIFISKYILIREPLDIYYGYFGYLILPFWILRFGLPRNLMLIFSILLISGFFQVFLGNDFFIDLIKVLIGSFAAYLFFYFVVFKKDFDIHTLFRFYLFGAIICSIFSFVQVFLYKAGLFYLVPGGPFGGRASSFFGEPTHLAMFLSGALLVAIHDFFNIKNPYYYGRLSAILVVSGVFLSFSGTLPGALAIGLLLILFNFGVLKYSLIGLPIIFSGAVYLINFDEEFSYRFYSTYELFSERPNKEINVFLYHGSSVILYNNFHVAAENFKSNFLFGGGVGSHPLAMEKYSLTKDIAVYGFNLNAKDANSMFNRLMSETGLFGLLLFFFIIRNNFVKRDELTKDNKLWLISAATLTVILINMVRQGHYFMNGFPFFVWMYIRAKMELNKQRMIAAEKENQTELITS
jgi:hypothetical protein